MSIPEELWSAVIPVKDEWELIPRVLPSWLWLDPDELLIMMDKPAHAKTVRVINKLLKHLDREWMTRIIEVEQNDNYQFHQAFVRRSGFLAAKYDRILTGDIDILVNKNCWKAIKLVGENGVGLASLMKFALPTTPSKFYRSVFNAGTRFLRKLVGARDGMFSGLYALHRPCWVDTEPEDVIQNFNLAIHSYGEDSHLRKWMATKHDVVCLSDIGGFEIQDVRRGRDKEWGACHAHQGKSLLGAFIYAVTRLRADYFVEFVRGRGKL